MKDERKLSAFILPNSSLLFSAARSTLTFGRSAIAKVSKSMYSLAPFVWLVTVLVAICFIVSLMVSGFDMKSNGALGIATVLWALYSCYETFIFDFIDPRLLEVRVDALLIFPALLGVTAVGVIRWVKGLVGVP